MILDPEVGIPRPVVKRKKYDGVGWNLGRYERKKVDDHSEG